MDVEWKRGVVFTGKQEGLWGPTKRVSAEDVRHMRKDSEKRLLLQRLFRNSLRSNRNSLKVL